MWNFMDTLALLVKSYLSKSFYIFKLIFNSDVFGVFLQVHLIGIIYINNSQTSNKNYFSFYISDSGLFSVWNFW